MPIHFLNPNPALSTPEGPPPGVIMRRITLFAAALALAVAPVMAKPTTVKGAKCTACHEGAPKDKKFNAATNKMFPKYKEAQCKDCHGAAAGKLTTTKK